MNEIKIKKDEGLQLARRYVESVTGEQSIGSFPIDSNDNEIIYIGVTVKSERKFQVRIHPYVDEIRLYEIIDWGNLSDNPHLQK